MALTKEGYKERLIDKKIDRYLKIFGALSIEGPKWCGKTWTSLNHCNSAIYLDETEENYNTRAKAEIDVGLILGEDYPELIDEWGRIPAVWDAVRHRCDMDKIKGKYILTEVQAPEGYQKSNKVISFTLDSENVSQQITIENYPEISVPNTNTASSILLVILGLGIIGGGIKFVQKKSRI